MAEKNQNSFKAFSFVEVMVAVFLVSVGLLAALKLLTGGLSATMDSRNQLIASLLAQEGTELVRSVRDSNWANGDPSFTGIGDGKYVIAYNDGNLTAATIDTLSRCRNCGLLLNGSFYERTGSTAKFYRMIKISSSVSGQKEILSLVIWSPPSTKFKDTANVDLSETNCDTVDRCAYAKDVLTNWGE